MDLTTTDEYSVGIFNKQRTVSLESVFIDPRSGVGTVKNRPNVTVELHGGVGDK